MTTVVRVGVDNVCIVCAKSTLLVGISETVWVTWGETNLTLLVVIGENVCVAWVEKNMPLLAGADEEVRKVDLEYCVVFRRTHELVLKLRGTDVHRRKPSFLRTVKPLRSVALPCMRIE